MKNKIMRKLTIFGLVCSMSMSMMTLPVMAAGTQTESETKQPETAKSETEQAETKGAGATQSETKQPETPQAETRQAETAQSEAKQPESETKAPETQQSETKQPETSQSGKKQPETPRGVEELLDQPGMTARATAEGELNISGGTEGTDYTVSEGVVTVMTNTPMVIAGDSGWEYTGKIVIEAKEAKLTLSGVILKSESGSVLTVKEGNTLDLTVDWDNELRVEVGNTHAVTLEKGAGLIIGGTGALTVAVPDDSKAKDFYMSRGDKKTDDTAKPDAPSYLNITGGTVVAKKGIAVTGTESQKVKVQISGGSVDLKAPDRNLVSLTNNKNKNVYKKIITLTTANAQIDDLAVTLDNYTYDSQGIYTNADKNIFLYLPAGKVSVNAERTEYSGTVTKDDEADKPNEWELKKTKAALEIEKITIPEVEYGYTADKLTAVTVTIKNTSANEAAVKAEIAGGQSKYFKLTQESALESEPISVTVPGRTSAGAAGVNQEIKIAPKATGLDAGTYTEVLKVTGTDGSSAEVTVAFTVKKAKVTLTSQNVKIDSKVYDGKKAATGTITMPEINGKTPELDTDKVTYKFNSANVKEATSVTVSNLELTDTWAKNYELAANELEVAVKNKITKAPNKHTKADLKTPSVTTVYSNAKGVWQPQLTTYKGQEYLFFGSSHTELTTKEKKSENWKFGDKATVKNRLVTISGGLKSGATYTVWTRFAGDDNHEPSDGEVMTYTTFTAGQNSSGSTTDANGNKINGLTEGTTYKTGSRLAFGAVGAGMSNTSPKTGDERYLPVSWKVSEEHTWSSAPYEAAFTINQAGSYTLQVTFRKQTYTNGAWTNTSTTTVSKVNFKMASTGANGTGYTTSSGTGTSGTASGTGSTSATNKSVTSTAAKTGDDSPVIPMAVIFLASAVVLTGYGWKRRSRIK